MDRRQFLAAASVSLALAGCSGQDDIDDDPGEARPAGNETDDDSADDSTEQDDDQDESDQESDTDDTTNEDDEGDAPAEPSFDVELSGPDTVDVEETFALEVTVTNTGEAAGEFESGLSIREAGGTWQTVDTPLQVPVAAGESETVTLDGLSTDAGGTVEFRVDDADAQTSVTIERPATFEFDITAPETVRAGYRFDIEATITNVGDRPGEDRVVIERESPREWTELVNVMRDVDPGEERLVRTDDLAPVEITDLTYRVSGAAETTVEVSPYSDRYVTNDPEDPSYEYFFRNFERFQGDAIYFEFGTVDQFVRSGAPDGSDLYRTYVHNGNADEEEDVALFWDGDERFVEGDQIELWGIVEDMYTYEAIAGNERTIPSITLVTFERRES